MWHERTIGKAELSADPEMKVQAARIQSSALELMTGRKESPKYADVSELPGGGKLGKF